MHHHSLGLVVLSVLAAVVAGYAALDFAQRSARASNPSVSKRWLVLAATTMGLGIWSMHFIGMLALNLGFSVQYEPFLVAASMIAAVGGAGVALYVVTRSQAGVRSVFYGAAYMGLAVAAMHYIGMASMEMAARIEWNVPLVVLSLAIAYGASLLALGLVFSLQSGQRWRAGPRALAGLAIGVGVGGLHYTGMAAATFHMIAASNPAHGVSTGSIAILLGVAAALTMLGLLFGANLDAQRGGRAQDLNVVAELMREVARGTSARHSICAAACQLTDARFAALLEPGPDGKLAATDSHGGPVPHDVEDAQGAFVDGRQRFRPGQKGETSSTLYEPIGFDEQRIGVLFVVWPHSVRRLSDRAVTVAGLLATEASFAIDRADMLERLERQASTDELTRLPNRRTVQAELDRQLALASRGDLPLSVAMLDLDHFKSFNDSHGHQGGDRLLEDMAKSWMDQLRGGDMAGRYGGEEFLVVLPQCDLEAAVATADRLRGVLPGGETCSAGVALWDGEETAEMLVARADVALYSAKARGRDRTERATVIRARPTGNMTLGDDPVSSEDATDWFASGESLRSALDVGVDALVLLDAAGRILEWNRAAERTFGWSRGEAIGAEVSELLKSDDLRAAHRTVAGAAEASPPEVVSTDPVDLTARHRDGQEVPVEMRLSAVDVGGRPHIVAFLRDMSANRETEVRLRRFESVVSASDDAIISGTNEGIIETWNAAAERLYGYAAEEMIGTDIGRLRPSGEPAGADEQRRRAIGEGRSVLLETQERRRDGSLFDVAATFAPMRGDAGEVIGFTAIARDVTDRKAAAARLVEAHSQFEGAFGAATIGMALVAPDGRFLAVNPALCALLKRDSETLLKASFQGLTHPDDLEGDLHLLQEALDGTRDSYRISKRYLLPDGGIVWGLLTVTLVRDVNGTPLHFVSQIQDIADRKTAEGEMRRYARHLEVLSNQDPLTGLSNRRAFTASLAEELNVQTAGGAACSMLLIAVDGDDAAIVGVARSVANSLRDDNLVAHLGGGEIAVLLPGVDAITAASILERTRLQLDDHPGLHFAHATAASGDEPGDVLARARVPIGSRNEASWSGSNTPGHVRRLLELARRQLGMPLSFLTRLEGDEYVFERMAGDGSQFGVTEGDALPLDGSHCVRMLDGRIGSVVHDLAVEPQTKDLEITKALGLRAYAGVPVTLRSGEVYGTLCAVDTRPHPELSERQIELLRFAAELTAELIDAVADDQAARLAETSATGVRTLLVALEARDFYTGEHSKHVVQLASAVARRLGLEGDEISDVEQVALLHDVGKVGIPDAILQKQGPLEPQEWELMRQHPVVGERIIVGTPGLSHLAPAMRAEHERWDGAGYPDGLIADDIPLASRITFACDAFHAMTSERPYRPAMTLERACEELRSCAGTQFDPDVTKALLIEIGSRPDGRTAAALWASA